MFERFVSAEQTRWKAVIDKADIGLDGTAKSVSLREGGSANFLEGSPS